MKSQLATFHDCCTITPAQDAELRALLDEMAHAVGVPDYRDGGVVTLADTSCISCKSPVTGEVVTATTARFECRVCGSVRVAYVDPELARRLL